MPIERFELTDRTAARRQSLLKSGDSGTAGSLPANVLLERLMDGRAQGVDVLTLDNGLLSVEILPTRGMGVWRAECRGVPVGWESPVTAPVHPAFVPLDARNGLGWLDGFNELVVRCGLAFNGPPGHDPEARSPIESAVTLHGRIANIPAHSVVAELDSDKRTLSLSGVVDECTMFGPQLRLRSTIRTAFGSNEFQIYDEITNLGSTPTDLELLYHVNVGPPFLGEGASIACAADEVVPRDPRAAEGVATWSTYVEPTPGFTEQVYYLKPRGDNAGEALAVLRNRAGDHGFAVRFNIRELPWFAVWKCSQPERDGYVTGLEPALNLPNFKAYERSQGRVLSLGPGEIFTSQITVAVLIGADAVREAEDRVQSIQGPQPAVVYEACQPGWSPAGEPT